MKQPSELHDDFISSAGVPTIPLKTTKRRAYGELVPYVFVALCLIIIILVGHDVVYALFTNLKSLYSNAMRLSNFRSYTWLSPNSMP